MLRRWGISIERFLLFQLIRLLRIRGQSERVARGFAVGLVVNFFPTFGFGVEIFASVARLCGGKRHRGLRRRRLLTFFWPLLFYLNLRMGGLFMKAPLAVEQLDDVTPAPMGALLWGWTFTVGAAVNCLIIGLSVYLVLRLVYRQMRPGALACLRRHARDHQRRFRLPRPPPGGFISSP